MIRLAALAVAVALTSVSVHAAEPAKKPAATAKKPAAKKSTKKVATKVAAGAAAAAVLAPASAEQMQAAQAAHFGQYACDFGQTLDLAMNPKAPGYVDIAFKNKTYTMKPVLSSTGALRLEDVTGRTLLIQIANKSMLMDVKVGQRLVDDCVHEKQRALSIAVKAEQAKQPVQ